MNRVLLISPHLDDVVLSAGQFMAGRSNCDVLTIFSGIPENKKLITPYDSSCGFKTSEDAMVIRRQEDKEACAILNANPIHTSRLDSQYNKRGDYKNLAKDLKNFITRKKYELIIGPLGIRHPDHVKLSIILTGLEINNLYLYEELPYRVIHPELVWHRISALPDARLTFIGDGDIADKVRALWCYKSQMRRGDLNPYNLYVPERFWRIR